jgi:RNA polymerase sigma-70 factor, ECF subfamily
VAVNQSTRIRSIERVSADAETPLGSANIMPTIRELPSDTVSGSNGRPALNPDAAVPDGPICLAQAASDRSLPDASAPLALARECATDRELFAALHSELKRIARFTMRRERPTHTLTPTGLVNEAFIKLFRHTVPPDFWSDLSRARGFITRLMQQILNDHADARQAEKRGGNRQRVAFDAQGGVDNAEGRQSPRIVSSELLVSPEVSETVLAVRQAVAALETVSPRQAESLRLSFFGGLTQDEIAAILGVSRETVKLDLRKAKAFLKVAMS